MKEYTGILIVNNGKFDRTYKFRVYANSYRMGAYRALAAVEKEFKRQHRGQRIKKIMPTEIVQNPISPTLDNPECHPRLTTNRAWLVISS